MKEYKQDKKNGVGEYQNALNNNLSLKREKRRIDFLDAVCDLFSSYCDVLTAEEMHFADICEMEIKRIIDKHKTKRWSEK